MTKLAIASDHGGFQLKQAVVKALRARGVDLEDLGTHDASSCDYPDYAHALASGLLSGRFSQGILICGTGIGMAMAANRHPGVRAAVVSDTYSARMAREHNDANVLCFGQRVVGEGLALDIVHTWLDTAADTDPRHARRIAKINLSP